MPAVPSMARKKAPGRLIIFCRHQDTDPCCVVGPAAYIFLPDDGQKQRTRGIHDRDIGQDPASIVRLQRFDRAEEERMVRDGSHGIIGDARRDCATNPCRIAQERIQSAAAALFRYNSR